MRIFVDEFVTGAGYLHRRAPESLLREGNAMVSAFVEDLAATDGVDVAVLRDARLAPLRQSGVKEVRIRSARQARREFDRLAASADWTALIAPEFCCHLLTRCRRVLEVGGRLLGPEPPLVELASDKQRTSEHLAAEGVPVACGRVLSEGDPLPADFTYPAVLKPRFGAGSHGVALVKSHQQPICVPPGESQWRLETLCPGMAASVAFLCAPGRQIPLPPCRQHISEDGRFTYLGGSLPIGPDLAARATRLACCAVATLPAPTGYLGVDLVLGQDHKGHEDTVIEINPRLTTSYVGLRKSARVNLAAALLAIRTGRAVELSFSPEPVQFHPDGKVYLQSGFV